MPENLWQKCAPDQDRGINTVPQQPSRSPTNNTLKVCRNIEILYNGEKMQQKKKIIVRRRSRVGAGLETDAGTEARGKNLCDHGRVLIE